MSECIRPGEISDDDLIGYAAGERTRRVREHVRDCPRCAALAADYAALENRLGRVLFRFDCPTGADLTDYHQRALGAEQRRQVDEHLLNCPHCTAELAATTAFLDAPLLPPARPLDLAAIERGFRRLVAQLVPTPRPALALRGKQAVTLVYTAEDLTLTLHPQQANRPRDHVQLLGFVHRADTPLDSLTGAKVRLLADGKAVSTTTVDEIGNFITDPTPQGAYDLTITFGTLDVTVPALDLVLER